MVNKKVGVGFGLVYVLVGVVGFFVTGFNGFASMNGPLLLGIFMLNPLHNIVHVLVGAVLVAGGLASIKVSRRVNTTVGAVYLLVSAMGLALQASTANILALNRAGPRPAPDQSAAPADRRTRRRPPLGYGPHFE